MTTPTDADQITLNLSMREAIIAVNQARRALAWIDGLYAGSSGDPERLAMSRSAADEVIDALNVVCEQWPYPDSIASLTYERQYARTLCEDLADFLCWCRGYRAADPRLPDMTGVRWAREKLLTALGGGSLCRPFPF